MQYTTSIQPSLPKLIQDYLDESDDLSECYGFSPGLKGLAAAAKARKDVPVNREVLVNALKQQAKSSEFASPSSIASIEALASRNCYTVVTGHQLCLYGGPMYFIYKIVSTIKWCKHLEKEGIKAVPVYWMASEDHDFEEINHVVAGGEKISWNTNQTGAVGEMRLDGISEFHEKLETKLSHNHHAKKELGQLKEIFSSDKDLSAAIRDFVYRIFGEYGIVVIDAADSDLKRLFLPIMKKELEDSFSEKQVLSRSEKLEKLGFHPQVTPREINLFWMENGIRERIIRDGQGYALADGSRSFSKAELFECLENSPEKFSPNVVLRPMYQEVILPNLGYIGGPGELSYWLQLKSAFDAAEVFFPVLLLRDMALIIDEKFEKKREQLELSIEELQRDRQTIIKEKIRALGTHEHVVEDEQSEIELALDRVVEQLEQLEEGLGKSARAERQRIKNRLETLRKKVLRHDKQANEVVIQRIDYLLQWMNPSGVPQERVLNYLEVSPDLSIISELISTDSEPFGRLQVFKA